MIRALDAETSALGVVTLTLKRSFWQYWRRVSTDIGECSVGITPQMCNRVTDHGDTGTFSRPAVLVIVAQVNLIQQYCWHT